MLLKKYYTKRADAVPYIIITLGILLRLCAYLHNRSLILDEVNVARNIYERGFCGLLLPLNYQQFAPPGFLWVLKLSTELFGYSEYAFRIYPFLCSIVTLILLYRILQHFVDVRVSWFVLFLFVSNLFFIRYSTEVKQYSSDMLITLSLILLALRTDITEKSSSGFFLLFSIAGCTAIWFSMPSVFILAAIGSYYFYITLQKKNYKKTLLLMGVSLLWALFFLIYYKFLLQKQVQNDYLQNWHRDYFIDLLPNTPEQLNHTRDLFKSFFELLVGDTALAIVFSLLILLVGTIYLFAKKTATALLFFVPVVCLYVGASLHLFTLLPRVDLFLVPIIYMLMAVGLQQLFKTRYVVINVLLIVICLVCSKNYIDLRGLFKPLEVEDFKAGMNMTLQHNIKGQHFHVQGVLEPVYIYYTKISPYKDQWHDLLGADMLDWDADCETLVKHFSGQDAVLSTWVPDDVFKKQQACILLHSKEAGILNFTGGQLYIYTTPDPADSLR